MLCVSSKKYDRHGGTAMLKIGEFSKLSRVSVRMLRHYDEVGLLAPSEVDSMTGYRYYGPRQFEVLNTIRYLRALDMPLGQIRTFLRNRDVGRIEQLLREQKAAVVRKQAELQRVERKIDNRLRQLHDAQTAELGAIRLVRSPACRIVWMSGALELHSFLDMEPSIRMLERSQAEAVVFLGKVGVGLSAERLAAGQFAPYDRAFLVLDDEDAFDGDVTVLPETTCAAVCFRGSHPEAPAQYARLMDYLRAHALAPADFSREITMIDYGLTSDPEKFVTEIRIPVTEA